MDMEENLATLKNGRVLTSEKDSEILEMLRSIKPEQGYQEDGTAYTWNESGMADLFAQCYRKHTRYCPERKSWYSFNGSRWVKDIESLLVAGLIREFYNLLLLYASEIEDTDKKTEFVKFVAKMGDRRFRDRLQRDARTDMAIAASEFDNHPNLINCKNGTFDLNCLQFRGHDYRDYITMETNFEYGMNVKSCKRWEKFIDEVTQGDKEKADYIQRALGYSILGSSKQECMFILYGNSTRNGKSTIANTVVNLLGDYGTASNVELICKSGRAKNPEAPTPALIRLKGRRVVTMEESSDTAKFDESIIKQFTGGEAITARELQEKSITFVPQFTLWLTCNSLPTVTDDSLFRSNRLRVIELNRHFNENEQDPTLKEYFESDRAMSGIFKWLVNGYFKYTLNGLEMADSLKVINKQYAKDNDYVLQFLEQKCEKDESGSARGKALYDSYKQWCRSNGFYQVSAKRFNAELMKHTDWYSRKAITAGTSMYYGLTLKAM